MITLYYAPDNASLAVRIVLERLGLPYQTQLVDRSISEQESVSYRRLNPNGLIPVCVIDGSPVAETAAIILRLAEQQRRLAPPENDPDRGRFLQWLFFLSNTLHTDLRQLFYPEKFVGSDANAQATHRAITLGRVQRNFMLFEAEYAANGAPYFSGTEPGIIDIYLATCARWAQLYPVGLTQRLDLNTVPALKTMLEVLQTLPAVQRACEAEGIAAPAFSAPDYANPPEGSAT